MRDRCESWKVVFSVVRQSCRCTESTSGPSASPTSWPSSSSAPFTKLLHWLTTTGSTFGLTSHLSMAHIATQSSDLASLQLLALCRVGPSFSDQLKMASDLLESILQINLSGIFLFTHFVSHLPKWFCFEWTKFYFGTSCLQPNELQVISLSPCQLLASFKHLWKGLLWAVMSWQCHLAI